MGTKADPGRFDCYANALPDEPMFVLLARDPHFFELVTRWADLRETQINRGNRPESDHAMVKEAFEYAFVGLRWRIENKGKWRITSPARNGPCRAPPMKHNTASLIPFPDRSMQIFEEELARVCHWRFSRQDIRETLRQCWRDIHFPTSGATVADPSAQDRVAVTDES